MLVAPMPRESIASSLPKDAYRMACMRFTFSGSSIVCNSQFASSEFICGTPWFDIATDLPRFVCGLAVVRWMERQLYAALPRCGMQLATTRLEKRPSFHGYLQSNYSHLRRRPSDCVSKS